MHLKTCLQSEPLKCGHLTILYKRTLGLTPTVNPPIQTHPHSRHFGDQFVDLLYSRKYWWELNLAVESQIDITDILVRLKFGGSVQDRHTFICMESWKKFFNLAVGRPTAKLPNFLAIWYLLNKQQEELKASYSVTSALNSLLVASMY